MSLRVSIVVPVAPSRTARVRDSFAALNATVNHEILLERGTNPSLARNRAIARARGAILAFTDDDCSVPPDWLDRALEIFDSHPGVDVVGGPQLTPRESGFFERMSGIALATRFGAGTMSRRYRREVRPREGGEWSLSSANLFIRRSALSGPEPFDPRLFPNEETQLLAHLAREGRRMLYDPDLVVYHQRRPTFAAFMRQCFGYGSGRARQDRIDRRNLPCGSVAVPLVFLAYLIALPALMQIHSLAYLPFALHFAGALWIAAPVAARERDPRAVVALPLILLGIHVAYPLGYAIERLRPQVSLRVARAARDEVPTG